MDTWKYNDYWSLKDFPPRNEQRKIINKIVSAMDNDYTNIIVEAGTGVGKSAIATTTANMVGSSYILTRTKQLQQQYLSDFNDIISEIKGRDNYTCSAYGGSCDGCVKRAQKMKLCGNCNFTKAKKKAISAETVLTDYHYLWNASNYSNDWDIRDLIIFDEAHKFEEFVMSVVSRSLNRDYYRKYYGLDLFEGIAKKQDNLNEWESPEKWTPIIDVLLEKFLEEKRENEAKFDKLEKIYKNTNIREEKGLVLELKKIAKHIQSLDKRITNFNSFKDLMIKDNWVVVLPRKYEIKNDSYDLKVEFKPVNVTKYTNTLLDLGETRLFLTGTIGDFDKFCEWININPDDTCLIQQPSNFPVKNRPVILCNVCNMKGTVNKVPRWKNNIVLTKIEEILRKHEGENGIIHTTSNYQSHWIYDNLKNKHNLWKVSSDRKYNLNRMTREELITRFKKIDEPSILIGAGIKDGVDFPDDECRFQILVKMPIPKFDAQVIARNREDKVWVDYQTIMDTVQAYGRGVRSKEDYCKFYVLDTYINHLLSKRKDLFTDSFLEAINNPRRVKRIPRNK